MEKFWTPKILRKETCKVLFVYDISFPNAFISTLRLWWIMRSNPSLPVAASLCYRHLVAESWRTRSSLLLLGPHNQTAHVKLSPVVPSVHNCLRLKRIRPRAAASANQSDTVKCVCSTCSSACRLFFFFCFCAKSSAPHSFLNKRRNLQRWLCTHTVGV